MRGIQGVVRALALGSSLISMAAAAQTAPSPIISQSAPATVTGDAPAAAGEIVVLGSRIPRVQAEGPAPVTTITSGDILRNG